jgi:hypothetical protein
MRWLRFFVTVHARPAEARAGQAVPLAGRSVTPLVVPPEALGTPWALSFEQAYANLQRIERLFAEPDGSFFWGSARDEPAWQVEGALFDRQGRLLCVDLKGTCPESVLDRLLAALGWPETPLMFQLMREGLYLDEADFRRYAREGGGSLAADK